jgi:hypothetical protein
MGCQQSTRGQNLVICGLSNILSFPFQSVQISILLELNHQDEFSYTSVELSSGAFLFTEDSYQVKGTISLINTPTCPISMVAKKN